MELKQKGTKQLKTVLDVIGALVEEATFTANKEGLSFRGLDPSHVAMVDVNIPNTDFEKFEVEEEVRFGVRVAELKQVLARGHEENDYVTIKLDGQYLNIRITNGYKRDFKMRCIESTTSNTPLPKISFNTKVVLTTDKFVKMLEDVRVVSDYISLESNADSIQFVGRGDVGECVLTVDKGNEGLKELNIKDASKATYSLEYLLITKLMKSSPEITLEYSSKMPMRVSVQNMNYFIAPRVEG